MPVTPAVAASSLIIEHSANSFSVPPSTRSIAAFGARMGNGHEPLMIKHLVDLACFSDGKQELKMEIGQQKLVKISKRILSFVKMNKFDLPN